MAENRGVWGIDVGQAALKAIHLRYAEEADQVIAVAFDYVPYPKILSQPDAVPEELIAEALEKFLSRNDVQGSRVAISVPGHTSLTRFISLPPVEESRVAEIVKYEARQQIPFALDEVIWDYQPLTGGADPDSGFMLDAEVGLFAMKRDQVMQHLRPFTEAKVEVDLIQVAPLGLYNFLTYDVMGIRPDDESPGREEHTIALDMGADNTTLLVSNGEKIWIRNVPIGGNHFTRALTKEMKLTFAKAEHLKCNATKSPDPRAVFQALRPVFNDYVSEIQRSIGYFSSVNPTARIKRILGLGNGFRLAGLQKFLQQNLQYDVQRVDSFPGLVGDAVVNAPLFQENILSFAVPYGIALQELNATRIRTTLLPPEIRTARVIRRKKPWAVAAVAGLMLAFSLNAIGYSTRLASAMNPVFDPAMAEADEVVALSSSLKSAYTAEETENTQIRERGAKLVENVDKKHIWAMVHKGIIESIPRDEGEARDETDISKQHGVKIFSVTTQRMANVGQWFQGLNRNRRNQMAEIDKAKPPSGPGYVFNLEGVHYHHDGSDRYGEGETYVVHYFLNQGLRQWSLKRSGSPEPVPVRAQGITHPVLLRGTVPEEIPYDPETRSYEALAAIIGSTGEGFGGGGGCGGYMAGCGGGCGTGYMAGCAGGCGYMAGGCGGYMSGMIGGGGMDYMAGCGGNPLAGATPQPQPIPGVQNQGPLTADQVRALKQQEAEKEKKTIHVTRFQVQFVWQPVYGEKLLAMDGVHRYLQENPQGDISGAKEYVQQNYGVVLQDEWFTEYKEKHLLETVAETAEETGT